MTPARPVAICLLSVCSLAAVSGCARDAGSPTEAGRIEHVVDAGDVRVTRVVSPSSLTTSERATIRVEVESRAGVVVIPPAFDGTIGDFTLVSTSRGSSSVSSEGFVTGVVEYLVEPFLDGEYTVPEMSYRWISDSTESTLTLPAARVAVASVLSESDVPRTEFRPIPSDEPAAPTRAWVIGAIAASAMIAGAAALLIARRRRPEPDWARVAEMEMRQIERQLSLGEIGTGDACARASAAVRRATDGRAGPALRRVTTCVDAIDNLRFRSFEPGHDEAMSVVTLARECVSELLTRPPALDAPPHPGTEN